MSDKTLSGLYDLHIHTAPDVSPRKCSDLELARRITEAGMAGCIIKCHYAETAARAALLREQFPHLQVAGGVVLNNALGGINAEAVERCGQMGGRYVWFPTMDALAYQQYRHRDAPAADLHGCLTILDENGALLPAVYEVLQVAARYKMLVGTGHMAAREGLALAAAAQNMDCTVVLTHADNPADPYTVEQQQAAVQMGALVEHCYLTTLWGRVSIEEIDAQIRAVGCDKVLLGTDLGQPDSPYPDEGIAEYYKLLAGQGFTADDLDLMFCRTPARLLRG